MFRTKEADLYLVSSLLKKIREEIFIIKNIKKNRKQLIGIISLFLVGMIFYLVLTNSGIKNKVTVEAGNNEIELKDFLRRDSSKHQLITRLDDIDFNSTGDVPIYIKYKDKTYESNLIIVDTTAPIVKTKDLGIILNGKEPVPGDFIEEIIDYTEVKCSYKKNPDLKKIGEQDIVIIAEDEYMNKTEVQSKLYIYDIKDKLEVEVGESPKIEGKDFLENTEYNIEVKTDVEEILKRPVGKYEIEILISSHILNPNIEIVDTTPPKASIRKLTTFQNAKLEVEEFVYDVIDMSPFTISVKNDLDFEKLGEQEVTIVITDEYSNSSEYKTILTIKADTEPPVIRGVTDKTVYKGNSISYRTGVTVSDNSLEELELNIDSSKVNLRQEGKYEVIYSAVDSAGNLAEKRATITVVELFITEEVYEKTIDEILRKIIKDNMGKREQAYEIYKWTKNHVGYTGNSKKDDWKNEAYRGIKNGNGDCFTYFAVAKALLTQVGIENIDIIRLGGDTKHYWNLVNDGTGWYHFDATRNKDKKDCFMLTDDELEKLNKTRKDYYYKFDHSLYPRTP